MRSWLRSWGDVARVALRLCDAGGQVCAGRGHRVGDSANVLRAGKDSALPLNFPASPTRRPRLATVASRRWREFMQSVLPALAREILSPMKPKEHVAARALSPEERNDYRDRLRAARYAALADAEGFSEICYAVEALGQRLNGRQGTMGSYRQCLRRLSQHSPVLSVLSLPSDSTFTNFDALYESLRSARNDAMHTGDFARNATAAAVELCVGLEEALMEQEVPRRTAVRDFMVKAPVLVSPRSLVAHARQLMLTHSFSFLPIRIDDTWKLVSELSLARYLQSGDRAGLLAKSISEVAHSSSGPLLPLQTAVVVRGDTGVADLLLSQEQQQPFLWLVTDKHEELIGVLSPFELM